eukprot:tig00000828_g4629.t1
MAQIELEVVGEEELAEIDAALAAAAAGSRSASSATVVSTESAASVAELQDIEDLDSVGPPRKRFRKVNFSVTQLCSQLWCEKAVELSLTTGERPLRTAAMKEGSRRHEKLEAEMHTFVDVETETAEDVHAVRLLNLIACLQELVFTGITREVPVFGRVGGFVLLGVIDEIRLDRERGCAVLVDHKTRAARSLPRESQKEQTRLQLSLYKCLFDGLVLSSLPAAGAPRPDSNPRPARLRRREAESRKRKAERGGAAGSGRRPAPEVIEVDAERGTAEAASSSEAEAGPGAGSTCTEGPGRRPAPEVIELDVGGGAADAASTAGSGAGPAAPHPVEGAGAGKGRAAPPRYPELPAAAPAEIAALDWAAFWRDMGLDPSAPLGSALRAHALAGGLAPAPPDLAALSAAARNALALVPLSGLDLRVRYEWQEDGSLLAEEGCTFDPAWLGTLLHDLAAYWDGIRPACGVPDSEAGFKCGRCQYALQCNACPLRPAQRTCTDAPPWSVGRAAATWSPADVRD